MAWPPATAIIGQTPDATWLNANLRDPLLDLRGLNGASVKLFRTSASQAISNSANTAISWQSTAWNVGTVWAVGSPTRVTIAVAGWYSVVVNAKWANNTTGRRSAGYRINGTGAYYALQQTAANGVDTTTGIGLAQLEAGDYLEILVFQNSGGSLNLTGGTEGDTTASVTLVGVGTSAPAWTTPKVWTAGQILSPALLNTYLRDALLTTRAFNGAGAWLYLSESQSISSDQRAPLSWDQITFNIGAVWTSGSQFRAPVPGIYEVSINLEWSDLANQAGVLGVGYRVNGSSTNHDLQFQEGEVAQATCNGSDLVVLNADDFVEFYGFHDTGESLSAQGGNPDQTHASVVLVAA